MKEEIGQKINEIRSEKGMTLKDLSEKTNLSIGFLSQIERGLTSIAITSLKKIAEALEVDLSTFFADKEKGKKSRSIVLRSYEQEYFKYDKVNFIFSNLSGNMLKRKMEAMMVTLLPNDSGHVHDNCPHEGEEFVYVLEGILTLYYDDEEYTMCPGDSVHFETTKPHNWNNNTNKLVKIITVNTPIIFNN